MNLVLCDQFYPYAGKNEPCSGNVHEVFTKYDPTEGQSGDNTEYSGGRVCDGHMQSFVNTGKNRKNPFSIVRSELIGSIGTPEGGVLINKEV